MPTLNDLGNLMLTFVMLWAYFSFSQFLIIWAGDLSDEIPWYLRRTQHGWQWIAIGLAGVHFFLPFLMLLSRRIKRSMTILSWIAIGVLTMTFVDLYWLIAPALSGIGVRFHWSMIVAAAGIGGIWLAIFADGLHRHAPIPLQDPNLSPYPEVYQ